MTLIIIILILCLVIYFYYQPKHQPAFLTGNSSDQANTIRELQTQLQQAQQLQTYNSQQLTQYETQVNRLKEQVKSLPGAGDWESQTASVITSLEQEVSDLTTERDAAIREKQTAEQDLLATTNRLKNKSQEAEAKANQIKLLKKEKSQSEIALNKTITELRTKYSKQGKLLDTEQLECKKLEEENEKLKAEIQQLKGGSH